MMVVTPQFVDGICPKIVIDQNNYRGEAPAAMEGFGLGRDDPLVRAISMRFETLVNWVFDCGRFSSSTLYSRHVANGEFRTNRAVVNKS